MILRPATEADWPGIWAALAPVFRAGTTYAIDRNITEEAAQSYWLDTPAACFVATDGNTILGTYFIRTNAQGGGAHVCNCGYVTAAQAQGRGVARAMCAQSQITARTLGYRAMQFNMVLASNTVATRLWANLGFETVGQVPNVFDHPELGLIDGLVLYKWLDPAP